MAVTTTVLGIKLTRDLERSSPEWHATIDEEAWCFYEREGSNHRGRVWQGFTADKLTGTPRLPSLFEAVSWVQEHQAEIAAKLAVRRKAGTRMVDPS